MRAKYNTSKLGGGGGGQITTEQKVHSVFFLLFIYACWEKD